MNLESVKGIADAVRHKRLWLFSGSPDVVRSDAVEADPSQADLFPRQFSARQPDAMDALRMDCVLRGDARGEAETAIAVQLRFSQLLTRDVRLWDGDRWHGVAVLDVDGARYYSGEETSERIVELPVVPVAALLRGGYRHGFAFGPERGREILRDRGGCLAGAILRAGEALEGCVTLTAGKIAANTWRLESRIENLTPLRRDECESRQQARSYAFVSVRAIVSAAANGAFVPLNDPSADLADPVPTRANGGREAAFVGGGEYASRRERHLAFSRKLFQVGDRVRVRPKGGEGSFDIVFAGKVAVVEAIEQSAGDRQRIAVTIQDDRRAALDLYRFQGSRLFFSSEELEPIS